MKVNPIEALAAVLEAKGVAKTLHKAQEAKSSGDDELAIRLATQAREELARALNVDPKLFEQGQTVVKGDREESDGAQDRTQHGDSKMEVLAKMIAATAAGATKRVAAVSPELSANAPAVSEITAAISEVMDGAMARGEALNVEALVTRAARKVCPDTTDDAIRSILKSVASSGGMSEHLDAEVCP